MRTRRRKRSFWRRRPRTPAAPTLATHTLPTRRRSSLRSAAAATAPPAELPCSTPQRGPTTAPARCLRGGLPRRRDFLWHVDKVGFYVCAGAYLGAVFGSVEMGLVVAVAISVLRVLLFVARSRTTVMGNVPDTNIYRRMDQYTTARTVPGVLVLRMDSPIYFANSGYLRERITRWIDDDDERTSAKGAVGSIDTSGTSMLDELKKTLGRRGIQIVLANPGSDIMKKLDSSKVLELIVHEWIFLTVGEAVAECDFVLHSQKPGMVVDNAACENMSAPRRPGLARW